MLRLVFAAWFCGWNAASALTHACPVHEGASGAAPAFMGAMQHSASGSDAEPMAGMATHHHGPVPGAPAHGCTCPGTCCGSVVAVVPGHPPVLAMTTVAARVDRPQSPSESVAAATAFARPPATGPPAPRRAP
jgi:hypothetical protein